MRCILRPHNLRRTREVVEWSAWLIVPGRRVLPRQKLREVRGSPWLNAVTEIVGFQVRRGRQVGYIDIQVEGGLVASPLGRPELQSMWTFGN